MSEVGDATQQEWRPGSMGTLHTEHGKDEDVRPEDPEQVVGVRSVQ